MNADDFGQSRGVNSGIIECFERSVVTSASLMVRWPAAEEAAVYARRRRDLSVGLHVDLGEWICRSGEWTLLYQVVDTADPNQVREEVSRQLEAFMKLMRRPPSHIDSHQHAHRSEPVRSILRDAARRLGVPLRDNSGVRYEGSFYGQTADGAPLPDYISVDALKGILRALPPGFTELGCHPAHDVDFETMYGKERVQELEALCNSGVREYAAQLQIQLRSFHEVSGTLQ